MLHIVVPKQEFYDENKQEFITIKEHTLQLQHSLVSLSKWEAKWKKPFLAKANPIDKNKEKTREETLDYIRCMTITQNVDPNVYYALTEQNIKDIVNYIDDPMTATIVNDIGGQGASRETLTSELLYYYMFSFGIPIECQKWHLNRLIILIKVFSIKNNPNKKKRMSRREIMERNRALNEQRKAALHSKG